ncbi:hypothetical protein BRADI_1g49290v3 [Brachypodium distachyon]|uniref:F-box domain-containing protein n=1 Tax=Brachypodium distachyon TaxID=15368 RepID=A0A0Q3L8Z1_BRADI|nr:hypothetical protein BRADI_1g49290v3 [Brachypodium distachyon]
MVPPQPTTNNKRSKNQQQQPSLPEETLVEIFSRLPAKSVGRCRCLSRSWAAALSSASFVDLHYYHQQQANQNCQNQQQQPKLLFATAQRCLHAWQWRVPVDDGGAAPALVHQLALPQMDPGCALRVLTPKPCHGLVLLHRWPYYGHYVCNPSTGALLPLPDTKAPSRMCGRYSIPCTYQNSVSYGLGCAGSSSASTKEHKVVRLLSLQEGSATTSCACEVFSLDGGAVPHWRPAAQRAPSCTLRPRSAAVFFDGRLHFLQHEGGGCIVTLGVCHETFGSLKPPAGLDTRRVSFELAVLDGRLCLYYGHDVGDPDFRHGIDDEGDYISCNDDYCIWQLRSYHGAGEWEQLCCIQRQSLPEALLHVDRISPLEIYRGRNGHRMIMFAASANLTVFTVDMDDLIDHDCGRAPPEMILLAPPTGNAVVDSFVETDPCSHAVGLLEESLVPLGRPSEEIIFSWPSTKAWSEVLKWLPTRCLVPLRRVCKDWRVLINSNRFMQLHVTTQIKMSPRRILLIETEFGSFWPLEEAAHFICNPTMGYFKKLFPDPQGGDASGFLAGRIGLGYDSREKKHVRVRLVYSKRNMHTRDYQLGCHVQLTDTESSWRPIRPPPRPVAEMQSAYAHGKLYWIVDALAGTTSGCEILALDVGTEEFQVLQGPQYCNYDRITSIVELQGNICLVCSERSTNDMDIWKLEEGGLWSIWCRVELEEFSQEY